MSTKIIILLSIFIMLLCFSTFSMADGLDGLDPVTSMNGFQTNDDGVDGVDSLKPVINAVIGAIQIAGTGISLIMVTIAGIKFMMSAPNEKADAKKQLIPIAIGAIILFGSVNIVQIVSNFVDSTFH